MLAGRYVRALGGASRHDCGQWDVCEDGALTEEDGPQRESTCDRVDDQATTFQIEQTARPTL